jgi:hypothetical protein
MIWFIMVNGLPFDARGLPVEIQEDAYRHAVRLDPDYSHAHAGLGEVFGGTERNEEAVLAYREPAASTRSSRWTTVSHDCLPIPGRRSGVSHGNVAYEIHTTSSLRLRHEM